jgi:ATP adenylyltransferase
MERLYTPWRMKYITSTHKKTEACVFCAGLAKGHNHDRENFILYRGRAVFVLMNIYPYNTGHLMILPYDHVAMLSEMSAETQYEMMALATYFTELLAQLMSPDGFNIGLNLGQAAGAGIDDHLHLHLVPRWSGDSNFMPVIGETRVLPEELGDTYDRIMTLLGKQPPEILSFTKEV